MEMLDYEFHTRQRRGYRARRWIVGTLVTVVALLGLDFISSPMMYSPGGGATLTVSIRVTDQTTGQPVVGALVQVHALNGLQFVLTDGSGSATLRECVGGSQAVKAFYRRLSYSGGNTVQISAQGYQPAEVKPPPGKRVKIFEIGPNPSFHADVALKPAAAPTTAR
jgi:hypothetical protein